ncbi:MAG: carboxylating nicotinate-nucleotide diphosphorylase [candidate division WOR-3 bacterium]
MNRLEKEKVLPLIRQALKEDIGEKDITTEKIVPKNHISFGIIKTKERAVLSGLEIANWVFNELGKVETEILVEEGVWIPPREIIRLKGNTRAILKGERVVLNFIQRLSGISTLTRKFVEKIKGTNALILDTRKTTPNLRYLEKYAVCVGGGNNHRMGLYDKVLIKDNHIKIAGGIENALSFVKGEIEVRTIEEAKKAIECGATHLLLDNMSLEEVKKVVQIAKKKDITLEYSGNVTLRNVRKIAETGVNYISIGALTHSYKSIDLSLLIK